MAGEALASAARRALLFLAPGMALAQPLPAGLQAIQGGGWRVILMPDATEPPATLRPMLAEIGRRLATETSGRVTIIAYATGAGLDPSFTRRLSLARGQAIEAALIAGGLAEARIDIRPMGRNIAVDVVDILPPGVQR